MHAPPTWYPVVETIRTYLPHLRPAHQYGLALWVYGAVLAQSACQNAVIGALEALGRWHTVRQYLREWLYDGADKAAPCQPQVVVPPCFAPLMRWLLTWWQSDTLAVAVDATAHHDRIVALVVSVLYRGSAIPVAWHLLPAQRQGAWMAPVLGLLCLLAPAVPRTLTVLVLADRGLWSPRLWRGIRTLGWHPLLRLQARTIFAPAGQDRQPALRLVPGPGHAWVGRGTAFQHRQIRRRGTLLVVWDTGQAEPWVLLTDLPPHRVGVSWYGLRVWIELGFRALKGVGWQWQHTRRTDPDRVARHWLVLAVATLWVLACGTRAEDADWLGRSPTRLRSPPVPAPVPRPRHVSVFRRGLSWLHHQLRGHWLWRSLWLSPEPWPTAPPTVQITYHGGHQ